MKNNSTKSEKRKDKKGRILRTGETQQPDGRYRYSYTVNGKQKSTYSWRLEKTDRLPAGKRECVALREQEKEIQKLIDAHVMANNITVLQMVEDYLEIHDVNMRRSTRDAHNNAVKTLKKDPVFCARKIVSVQIKDVKKFFLGLQKKGITPSCLRLVKNILFPAFRNAYEEQMIMINPAAFNYSDLIQDNKKETAYLTEAEEEHFLYFIKNDENLSHRYEAVYILFHTGLRISEFCGLTLEDVDFRKGTISVNKQLRVDQHDDMYIERPKTKRGERTLPMTDDVAEQFRILQRRVMQRRKQPSVDGVSGFFFTACNDERAANATDWTSHFRSLNAKYKKTYPDYPLPNVTPHVCRHTYCSRMAATGMQPKALQYLMGHSDISTTLGVYTHISADGVREAVKEALQTANQF